MNVFDMITMIVVAWAAFVFVIAPLGFVAFVLVAIRYGSAQTAELNARIEEVTYD